MTARRLNITTRKTPALTGGDERPTPACQGNPWSFDVLIDQPRNRNALRECLTICNAMNEDGSWVCPIRDTCWTDNQGEEWVQALSGNLPPQWLCTVDDCDRPNHAKGLCSKHYRSSRKAAA